MVPLALADMGHSVKYEMSATALRGRVGGLGNSALEAFVSIGSDQLYATQATPDEASQEVCPKRFCL